LLFPPLLKKTKLFSKYFIKERAKNYAQRLFEDFITKKEV